MSASQAEYAGSIPVFRSMPEQTAFHLKSPAIRLGISHTALSFLLFAKSHARLACSPKTSSPRLAAASSCGPRLWLRRINRLTSRRPPRQQILAVSRTAGARMCCQLFTCSRVQLSLSKCPTYFSCGFHMPEVTF